MFLPNTLFQFLPHNPLILFPDSYLDLINHPMKTNISEAINKILDEEGMPLFNIYDLASNKAYSMGHRPAWRDYVDIFFILKKGTRLETIKILYT